MAVTNLIQPRQAVPPAGVFAWDSQGGLNSSVVTAGPCCFLRATVTNAGSTGTLYFQIFDTTTVLLAQSAIPIIAPFAIAQGATVQVDFSIRPGGGCLYGKSVTNGLVWISSTTALTVTADTHSDTWVSINYATGTT